MPVVADTGGGAGIGDDPWSGSPHTAAGIPLLFPDTRSAYGLFASIGEPTMRRTPWQLLRFQ
ncbi:hypothetical protein ACRAWF_23005 [Streptomyces sp. L7]